MDKKNTIEVVGIYFSIYLGVTIITSQEYDIQKFSGKLLQFAVEHGHLLCLD